MFSKEQISNFEISSAQTVSSAIGKIVNFRVTSENKSSFGESLKKFRAKSFFIILQNDFDQYLIISLDQAIIGPWLGEDLKDIGENEFKKLKNNTSELTAQVKRYFTDDQKKWKIIRWETHPNFLAVLSAERVVTSLEFNVHIGRNSGKMNIVKSENTTE